VDPIRYPIPPAPAAIAHFCVRPDHVSMAEPDSQHLRKVCRKPVGTIRDDFGDPPDIHIICRHFAFEHDGNPDEPCGSINCPQFLLLTYRDKLASLGIDTEDVVEEALQKRIAQRKGSG
jgi:hypothetical protein